MKKILDKIKAFFTGIDKNLLRFVALALVIGITASLPFVFLVSYAASMKDVYSETFYAELGVKFDRLKHTTGKKVVVIGGSSVAFGIDSKLFEKETGLPCVNFGLYASIGLKPMLDLSLTALNKGDIVVIAPELDAQMYSSYVGYDSLLKASENRSDIPLALGLDYAMGLFSGLTAHISAKRVLASSPAPTDGVYSLAAFDGYGDIVYPREANIMDGGYSSDNIPSVKPVLVTKDFTNMINAYVRAAELRGATVYFGFSPVNALSLSSSDRSKTAPLTDALGEKLACRVIQSLPAHIMDAGYFYDSNYHMNDVGMTYNTMLLVDDIKRELGMMTADMTEYPSAPPYAGGADIISSGSNGRFFYDITANGAVITGLTKSGLNSEKLNVPSVLENVSVYKIANGAFAGCSAKEIHIPATVTVLSAKLFDGATSLEVVTLDAVELPEVGDGLLDGAPDGAKIAVPASAYPNYVTNYFWSRYSSRLKKQGS